MTAALIRTMDVKPTPPHKGASKSKMNISLSNLPPPFGDKQQFRKARKICKVAL